MAVLKGRRRQRDLPRDSRGWLARRFVEPGSNWLTRRLQSRNDTNAENLSAAAQSRNRVAVIGSGASGLVCARECLKEGHEVVIFEQKGVSGGTWRIDDVPTSDLPDMNGLDEHATRMAASIHSSMYDSVRVILPRELMGFTDFPFDTKFTGSEDSRRFCAHDEVKRYLEAFEAHFNLTSVIQFNSTVVRVEPTNRKQLKWDVEVQTDSSTTTLHKFDAVVVATGHYTKPRIPVIPNIQNFRRPTVHSHVYRKADSFAGARVVILGNSISGTDLARDIGLQARAVFLCGRSWPAGTDFTKPVGVYHNIHLCCTIKNCLGKGQLELEGGLVLDRIDCLIFCTGYLYDFPFLKPTDLVTTEERMVYPLYKQLFHPYQPTLTFATLQYMVVPFILAEHQAKLMARVFSGKVTLPSTKEMVDDIERSVERFRKANSDRLEKFHYMKRIHYDYMVELAVLCKDVLPLGEWRRQMHEATFRAKARFPDDFKDREMSDDEWCSEAKKEFAVVRALKA